MNHPVIIEHEVWATSRHSHDRSRLEAHGIDPAGERDLVHRIRAALIIQLAGTVNWVGNWVTLLSAALAEGIQRGQFKNMDPEGTARTISAIYQGVAVRWYLDPKAHSTAWATTSFQNAIRRLLAPHMAEKPS